MARTANLSPIRAAARTRRQLNAEATPLCAADCAERLEIEVRFLAIPSLEGMYLRGDPPRILVASERPRGRQAMTIAHEIGHHVLGHAGHLASHSPDQRTVLTTEENEANLFAAHFLMPRSLLLNGFDRRGYSTSTPDPLEVLVVAGWLGVSFEALVRQMGQGTSLLGPGVGRSLLSRQPKDLRKLLLLANRVDVPIGVANRDVFLIDAHWRDQPIDLCVGDIAIVPEGCNILRGPGLLEGRCFTTFGPGLGQIAFTDGRVLFFRSCRRDYAGLATFRHLESVPGENEGEPDE